MKILILGAGASGMTAALTAAKNGHSVTLLERQARVGRKLLATGNGRCNLSNLHADVSRYHGENADFARPALSRFGTEQTLLFFRSLGLLTVMEPDGKFYPLSDQANSVVDVLRFALDAAGVNVVCGCEVRSVRKKARGYQAECADGQSFFGDKLIVAAGGCAGRKLGGTEDGYRILQSLGHSCTDLRPALVQLKTDPSLVRALKGVRADAKITLKSGAHTVMEQRGEVQFTEYGVSGPAIFALSRAAGEAKDGVLLLNFLRDYEEDEVTDLLKNKCARFPRLPAEELLAGILHGRLGKTVVHRAIDEPQKPLSALTEQELSQILRQICYFALPVTGRMGMDNAQVTAGGIRTAEFSPQTLESRLAPGVFAAGEVLDIDGDCGGFNLQWAWSSGYVAGCLGELP